MNTRCDASTDRSAIPAVPRSVLIIILSILALAGFATASLAAADPANPSLSLFVDAQARPGGNGSRTRPFKNLPEAVDEARTQSASYDRVYVVVRAGSYHLASTLRIDFPVDITGSNVPLADNLGWPLGSVTGRSETLIVAGECIGTVFAIGREDGTVISNVSIRNLSVTGDATGCSSSDSLLQIQHTQYFTVADLILSGLAGSGIDIAASSGRVARNFVAGMGACGICISAGTAASPAQVTALDNRSKDNSAGGLLINGTTFPLSEVGELLDVNILHNDLSNNEENLNLGFGARVIAIGPTPPAEQESGQATVRFFDNRMDDNQRGIMIDAGFPHRKIAGQCDNREFTAQFDLVFRGNTLANNLVKPAVFAFTRGQVVTAGQSLANWQYLHDAVFRITDPDSSLRQAELNHPVNDPWLGECDNDSDNEALMNTLIYNGSLIHENM